MNKTKDSVNQQVEENNGNIIGNNNGVVYYGMNYLNMQIFMPKVRICLPKGQ